MARPAAAEGSAHAAAVEPDLRSAVLRLLADREDALRRGDRTAFLATLDPDADADGRLARTQARWFDNLARLPAADISYSVGDQGLLASAAEEGTTQVVVDFTMRLAGFDAHPATRPMVWTVTRDGDRVLLAGERSARADQVREPWDVSSIDVRRSPGLLGVFGAGVSADALMAAASRARDHVRAQLGRWDGRAVVYAVSGADGTGPDHAGAQVRVVPRRPGSGRVAGQRLALDPDLLDGPLARDLTLRHEMAHLALGTLDDHSPVWLIEGAAELVARADVPLATRLALAGSALPGPGEEPVVGLPRGAEFYGSDAGTNYELATLVCDYLARDRGLPALWDLMRAYRQAGADADTDRLLLAETGHDSEGLASAALAWFNEHPNAG